jgi:hypothetical protein
MNSTVRAALANGTFSAKNSRIDAKSVVGFVKLDRYSILSSEELEALTEKFGQGVVAACSLVANDAQASAIASAKAAEAGSAQVAMAAKTGVFAPKGQEVGAGIRHGFADE